MMYKIQQATARKQYQALDGVIEPGQTYYYYTPRIGARFGNKRRFVKYPRPSQRTDSEYLRESYSLREQLEDAAALDEDGRDELVSNIEALRDAEQDKLDNMEQYGLQDGDSGQMIQERIENLDAFLDVLQSLDFEAADPTEAAQEVLENWPD